VQIVDIILDISSETSPRFLLFFNGRFYFFLSFLLQIVDFAGGGNGRDVHDVRGGAGFHEVDKTDYQPVWQKRRGRNGPKFQGGNEGELKVD
jgi:hypothetical protein